eukprot:GHVU01196719.1.p3 GENE.GHVU01196719.1~~GHVU01196719.1.p3  ORF type:complete len:103 (+),score=5.31 GHVU01196719.1:733-1041(+)
MESKEEEQQLQGRKRRFVILYLATVSFPLFFVLCFRRALSGKSKISTVSKRMYRTLTVCMYRISYTKHTSRYMNMAGCGGYHRDRNLANEHVGEAPMPSARR